MRKTAKLSHKLIASTAAAGSLLSAVVIPAANATEQTPSPAPETSAASTPAPENTTPPVPADVQQQAEQAQKLLEQDGVETHTDGKETQPNKTPKNSIPGLGGNSPFRARPQATGVPNWGIPGADVSSHQGNVDWAQQKRLGARWASVKATEGLYYKNPYFGQQYGGSYDQGLDHGAYHFGIPTQDARQQARFFVANGGGWSPDGRTKPGMLDLEYNPYGHICYGKTKTQTLNWIRDFADEYKRLTSRYPTLYSTTDWLNTCVGDMTPVNHLGLWVANYSSGPGRMPVGYTNFDIWQSSSAGPFAGDSNVFRGTDQEYKDYLVNPSWMSTTWRDQHPQHSTPVQETAAQKPAKKAGHFWDVPANHQFYTDIEWAANKGIVKGWDDGNFRPEAQAERQAIAAFFYRMAGEPEVKLPASSPFKDVSPNDPFYKEIVWMSQQGITLGWEDGTFRPHDPVSREAMAAFFYRFAGRPSVTAQTTFNDVRPASTQFYKEISWLQTSGITTGWPDGTFRPYAPVERGAIAAFMHRYDNVKK